MARNEKLITRHPAPKPEDDRYMLDRWTPEVMHKTRQVYRVETIFRDGGGKVASILIKNKWYRVECLCGWRSQEFPRPMTERCPVLDALTSRARSLKRDGERIEWKPVESGSDNEQKEPGEE